MAKQFRIIIILILIILLTYEKVLAYENASFEGSGTLESPYLISSQEDLVTFQELVNKGEHFKDIYFKQTNNINLQGIEWTPIGEYGTDKSFDGIYDGNGYHIDNLHINISGNNGFFGQLGGIIMNFGIESGEIHGVCVGSISSHAASSDAKIINCYNKATIYGSRAGGIADNFNGMIINCWTDCILNGETTGDIYSYTAMYAINNFTNNGGQNSVNASTLNSTLINTSITAGVKLNQLNEWGDKYGEIKLISQKRNINIFDFPQLILANLSRIALIAIIVLQVFLFIRVMLERKVSLTEHS